MSKYKIAIIVFWFGPLPVYFPAWVASVEKNEDIEFFLFSDQPIGELPANLHYIKTTLRNEVERFSEGIGEKVDVDYGYKFCDLRPFIPMAYHQLINGFDFWGYCDVDLAFGKIRDFLTDDKLDKYERFYEWGHLSVLKNNEKMNHLYYLPGSIYSMDETLRCPVLLNADEKFGLNRICAKNNIAWYNNVEYVDLCRGYSDLLAHHGLKNYQYQVFYWENGHAYRAFIDSDGKVGTDEFIYIHWQKRLPKFDDDVERPEAFYITSTKFIGKEPGVPDKEMIMKLGALKSDEVRRKEWVKYLESKIWEFVKAPMKRKQIWLRQKVHLIRENRAMIQ